MDFSVSGFTSGLLMRPLAVMNSVGSWCGIAASGPRMDDSIMIAIGRVGTGRVHGRTSRDVARFADSVQRVANERSQQIMNETTISFLSR